MVLLCYLVSFTKSMLQIAKLIITKYMAVDSIHRINERCCTPHQLYAKQKSSYSIRCVTHSSPNGCRFSLLKPEGQAGDKKSYQDKWSRNDQEQVVLMDRGSMA